MGGHCGSALPSARLPPPCGRGPRRPPSRAAASQPQTAPTLTQKRAASTRWLPSPASCARNTRPRRSTEYGRGMEAPPFAPKPEQRHGPAGVHTQAQSALVAGLAAHAASGGRMLPSLGVGLAVLLLVRAAL